MKIDQLLEGRPEVGLFWIEPNGEISGLGSSDFHGNDVVQSGNYLNYLNDHSKYWPVDFKEKYPGKDQRHFAKGRVSRRTDNGKFLVELPSEMKGDVNIRRKVIEYFSLPSNNVEFSFFSHHDKGNFNPGEYK